MRCLIAFMAVGFLLGCGDGEDQPKRLIPPGDADYSMLEAPEVVGECTDTAQCEISCTHVCAPIPPGPVTCPADPPPKPDRVQGAECICADTVCAYY